MPPKNNLAKKLANIPAIRTFAVTVPANVAEQYDKQAQELTNFDTGALLSARLAEPVVINHTSELPLYFTDEQRNTLNLALGYNFKNAKQVIERIHSLLTVIEVSDNEETAKLKLSETELFRLTERAKMAGKSVPEYAKQVALDAIRREIGLF
jgi:hypothetical protein